MGAQQSAQDTGHDARDGKKTCYYELIGVEWNASDLAKALELHPDRNLDDVHEATRKFAEIQAAYEILSNPQERAWYDFHRDAILNGIDDPSIEPTSFRNIRLTSTEEILGLTRELSHTKGFDDESTGFFGIVRGVFEHLIIEEEAAAGAADVDCPQYPTFGFSDDKYETVVKPFYAFWSGFSTRKSFSWKENYRLSDAPDRRVRRVMEKENKKCREDAIRQFNEAVRFLTSFVRRRDPRYVPNIQTHAERQKSLRNAAASQAARSRAANQQKVGPYEDPDWTRLQEDDAHGHDFSDIEEESEVEILQCVVCNKCFKSLQQLEVHERSKKHNKTVQQLRLRMEKEGVDLGLNSIPQQAPGHTETTVSQHVLQAPLCEVEDDLTVDATRRHKDRGPSNKSEGEEFGKLRSSAA
ncbi:hypothetical protein E4U41_004413 [Claviceps citrina]|nr:hypothetical protein E4U41_004413 [Claviceps citrina]